MPQAPRGRLGSLPRVRGSRRLVAIYPGTFDPITNGHFDIMRRALGLFDQVVVALAVNVHKRPMFSLASRVGMIEDVVGEDPRVEVDSFRGLLVDYARSRGARFLIRGLRAVADFEYEFQFAHMNRQLAPDIDTIFLPTNEENFYVSSSLVREVGMMGGDVAGLVPAAILQTLKQKFRKKT
jgi:pantetheine-phosphate adenylyltransferase